MANEIRTFRLPGGRTACIGQYQQEPLWSTVEWADDATPDLRAFTYTQGQRVPSAGLTARNATFLDTNKIPRASKSGRLFLAYGLTYEIFAVADGGDPADFQDPGTDNVYQADDPVFSGNNLRKLQRQLLLDIIVGSNTDRPDIRLPFSRVGQSIGAVAFASTLGSGTVALDYGTGGTATPKSQRAWSSPLIVPGHKVLQVRVQDYGDANRDNITQDVRLRLVFDGLRELNPS